MRDKYDLRRIIQNALAYNSTLNTQISTLRFAQQSVAGSGFAPQAHAYSVIPALPYYIIYYNRLIIGYIIQLRHMLFLPYDLRYI